MNGAKINKLALGTVQFGLDYGISNKYGKTTKEEVREILKHCYRSNIDIIDTAQIYGDSEKIIGNNIAKNKFKIISKLASCNSQNITNSFNNTLQHLGQENIYGFLIHDFDVLKENINVWNCFLDLKKQKKVEKIGISLYYPEELEYIYRNNINIDIIQVPYSIFDRRFENYFKELKKRNIEIHVRSIFLQGLVFINPEKLKPYFLKIKNKLIKLYNYSETNNISIASICLNFVILNKLIDKIIIGVDNLDNLKTNVKALDDNLKVKDIYTELLKLKEDDEKIILPFNWK